MESTAVRIKKRRKLLGYTQKELAELVGIRGQSISGWERGLALPNGKVLQDLAKHLDVPTSWLLYGEYQSNDDKSVAKQQLFVGEQKPHNGNCDLVAFVKMYDDINASAGYGYCNVKENNESLYPIPVDALKYQSGVSDVFCIRTYGNSMEPLLTDGSVLAVNPSRKRIIDGRMYVVRTHESLRVKFIKETHEGIVLDSFNPSYKSELIEWAVVQDGAFEIVGEVFWFSSKLNH
jgi:phage repressor protein C with HTH and peptisase S24 domain